jgi:hypothetical protein
MLIAAGRKGKKKSRRSSALFARLEVDDNFSPWIILLYDRTIIRFGRRHDEHERTFNHVETSICVSANETKAISEAVHHGQEVLTAKYGALFS